MKILVVDDSQIQRLILRKWINDENKHISEFASDGERALSILKSKKIIPDLIITDLAMPMVDGIELIITLKSLNFSGNLIIMSGCGDELLQTVRGISEESGFNVVGVLAKPIQKNIFLQILRGLDDKKIFSESPLWIQDHPQSMTIEEIRIAIKENQFEVWYQPIINTQTGGMIGLEALARWHHPVQGLVSLERFIPIVSQSQWLREFTVEILRQSIFQFSSWKKEDNTLFLSINLPPEILTENQFFDDLLFWVNRHEIQNSDLLLELTESDLFGHDDQSTVNLVRYRLRRFQLALDCYGTGFSSMEQLGRIPLSYLKLDKSVVTHAEKDARRSTILSTTIEMAHKMNLKVIAEGVETLDTWKLLRDLKCDLVQGYYFSRPLPPSQIESSKIWTFGE